MDNIPGASDQSMRKLGQLRLALRHHRINTYPEANARTPHGASEKGYIYDGQL